MHYFSSVFLFVLITVSAYGQQLDYNLKGGYLAKGYDLVSYFDEKPEKGNKKFSYQYQNFSLKFINQTNLDKFKNNPEKYLPQYGGYCAYAMGLNGDKVSINPKTYEIRNEKLYLFYNAWGINTLSSWLKESPNQLKVQADKNWQKVRFK